MALSTILDVYGLHLDFIGWLARILWQPIYCRCLLNNFKTFFLLLLAAVTGGLKAATQGWWGTYLTSVLLPLSIYWLTFFCWKIEKNLVSVRCLCLKDPFTLAKCNAKLQKCKNAKLQNCKIAKLQNCKIAKLQNCKIAKLQNCQIAKLQNCKIVYKSYFGCNPLLSSSTSYLDSQVSTDQLV